MLFASSTTFFAAITLSFDNLTSAVILACTRFPSLEFCGLQCLKYGLQFLGIFLLLEKLRKPLKKNCTRGTIVLIMCLHDDKSLG